MFARDEGVVLAESTRDADATAVVGLVYIDPLVLAC